MIELWFEGVMCFYNPKTKKIFSAKLKELKPQRMKEHNNDYYMIKYCGKKRLKSYNWLMERVDEKLHRKDK